MLTLRRFRPVVFAGLATALLVLFATPALAVPNLISYQGQLNDQNGVPINATVAFIFSIYDVPAGGTALWTEAQSISVTNGLFNVQLGAVTPLPSTVFTTTTLYLGVKAGADSEMTPRQKMVSGAFAHTASQLDKQVSGDGIAREAIWPEHAGRSNTIKSYLAEFTTNGGKVSFAMPADKNFIITDVVVVPPSTMNAFGDTLYCQAVLDYTLGATTVTVFRKVFYNVASSTNNPTGTESTSFKAGIPIPAGATLRVGTIWNSSATPYALLISGFQIPATP